MRTMPPEAFTNKELAQAMHWRESQPEYVKAMTTTPETLISLYKKAMRTAPGMGNNSKMSESFRSDLKNIADGLKEFEPAQSAPAKPNMDFIMPERTQPLQTEAPPRPVEKEPAAPMNTFNPQPQQPQQQQQPRQMPNNQAFTVQPRPVTSSLSAGQLDEGTLAMIREVKTALNLSSENEALRMLVKLGFDRARSVLPPSLNI